MSTSHHWYRLVITFKLFSVFFFPPQRPAAGFLRAAVICRCAKPTFAYNSHTNTGHKEATEKKTSDIYRLTNRAETKPLPSTSRSLTDRVRGKESLAWLRSGLFLMVSRGVQSGSTKCVLVRWREFLFFSALRNEGAWIFMGDTTTVVSLLVRSECSCHTLFA